MPTNDFLAYATGSGANVVDQATYASSTYVSVGRSSGILPSNVYNKIARQASYGTAALAQFIVNQTGQSVFDDGNLANFITQLTAAIQVAALQPATTGDAKLTLKNVADSGWLLMNDGTIGNASSGAGYANAAALDLYTLIWNNVVSTYAPIYTSGGSPTSRGVSAAADWTANKRLALTQQLGRAIVIAGAGSGLTSRSLGQTLGEETHILTAAESAALSYTSAVTDPGHNHGFVAAFTIGASIPNGGGGSSTCSNQSSTTNSSVTGISVSTSSNAGGGAHNNMQPSTCWSIMIKL